MGKAAEKERARSRRARRATTTDPARRALALAAAAIAAMLAAAPLTWRVSVSGAANRIDTQVAAHRAEYVAYEPPAWPGDRDCDTAAELAARYPSPRALDDEVVQRVEKAVRCRRAWNAETGLGRGIERRTFGSYTVDAYLRAASGSEPDGCVAAAATALELVARLGTAVGAESEMVRIPAEHLLGCVARASPAARAAAQRHVEAAAFDPASPVAARSAWPALQPAAVATASVYAERVRESGRAAVMLLLLTRPRAARAVWEWERWARHALAIAEGSRACDATCLVGLIGKSRRHVTSYPPGGPSRPLYDAASRLLWFRSYFQAAIVALDPSSASDPRLASPWDGSAMRVVPSGDGMRVEWRGPDGATFELPSREHE